MAKFTDGTRFADLYAGYYVKGGVSCDISPSILDAASLRHTEDGYFIVEDMDAALMRLDLWCNGWGPFHSDEDTDPFFDDRTIAIDRIKGYSGEEEMPPHLDTFLEDCPLGTLTFADFQRLLFSALDFYTEDAFIADQGGSIDEAHLHLLPIIYAMGHGGLSFASIANAREMSMRRLYNAIGIPSRTAEHWSTGQRTPPTWQLPLIAYVALSIDTNKQ